MLNTKMLFKRKYEIVDGVERFKKWKGRLAVVGTGEIPGIVIVQQLLSNSSI